jgi:cell wall-associated NlpC family hydrolase
VIDSCPYVGLAYRRGGRERPAVDCWGLVRLVYREQLGIELDPHATDPDLGRAIVAERSAWAAVPPASAKPGDVVLVKRPGQPFHVGVLLAGRRLLHADEPFGVAVERVDRVLGSVEFWRHPALAAGDPVASAAPVPADPRDDRDPGRADPGRDDRDCPAGPGAAVLHGGADRGPSLAQLDVAPCPA